MSQGEPFRDAALAILKGLPDFKSLSYLELGCGDGFILDALHQAGAKVRGTTYRNRETDYIRTRDYPEYLQVDGGVDLNKPLPYPDASFDVVYTTEVMEHVEGHRNFITEAGRVLKPGGYLVLTTPNLHRILSRVHFALSGVHLTRQELIPWNYPLSRMEEFHHRCADFPLLHWLLWQNGLRIQRLAPTHVKPASRLALLFKPFFRPLVRRSVLRYAAGPMEAADEQGRRDLMKWMNDSVLLSSEQICLMARKGG